MLSVKTLWKLLSRSTTKVFRSALITFSMANGLYLIYLYIIYLLSVFDVLNSKYAEQTVYIKLFFFFIIIIIRRRRIYLDINF